MIRLPRSPLAEAFPKKQLVLFRKESQALKASMRSFYGRAEHSRRQERPEFPKYSSTAFRGVMEAVLQLSHGKCAYCEAPLEGPDDATLDRFRPKAGALGLDSDFSTEHYWWLAYEWENLYPACAACNRAKGPKFPVEGKRAPIGATTDQLAKEKRLLLDPCADDPTKHLEFADSGLVSARTSPGDVTIATLELNRGELVQARVKVAASVLGVLGSSRLAEVLMRTLGRWFQRFMIGDSKMPAPPGIPELAEWIAADRPYAAAARAVMQRWVRGEYAHPRLKRQASRQAPVAGSPRRAEVEVPEGSPDLAPRTRREAASRKEGTRKRETIAAKAQRLSTQTILRLAVKNLRGVRDLDLQIHPGETGKAPWQVLLGENGTGKSSLLQGLALALLDERAARSLDVKPEHVLRQGQPSGWVKVWIGDSEVPRELHFSRYTRSFRRQGPPYHPVLLGYGATRLLPGRKARPAKKTGLDNLFDPFQPLIDADRWLAKLDPESFDFAARAIKDVLDLPKAARLKRHRKQDRVSLRLFGSDLTLDQLSDGYQSVLGLTCDLLAGLRTSGPKALEAAEGLVLLDELGAHLHPRWRMRIVGRFRRAFPRVQFLVSTHDPLCLRGLEDGEATVLRRTDRGRIYAAPDLPPLQGLRVDQLLTSEYFGLDSTLDPQVEKDFREMYRLLALRQQSTAQKKRIGELREQLAPHEVLGVTRRERRMMEILDRELARVDQEPDPELRKRIRKESEAQITADLNVLLKAVEA